MPATLAGTATGGRAASAPKCSSSDRCGTTANCKATGNVLAVRDPDGATRFLVHEGWRTITEIGGQGNLMARHELDLPPQAAVSQLQYRRGCQRSTVLRGLVAAQPASTRV